MLSDEMTRLVWETIRRKRPAELGSGPHLFIDDHLVGCMSGVKRTLHRPEKRPEPLICDPGKMVGIYSTVVYDDDRELFRMWYIIRYKGFWEAYAESRDGMRWTLPKLGLVTLDDGDEKQNNVLMYGVYSTIIDEGPVFEEPRRRYKILQCTAPYPKALLSADGIHWSESFDIENLPSQGVEEDWRVFGVSDILSVNKDPLKNRYMGIFKQLAFPVEGYDARARASTPRFVVQSSSEDFIHWEPVHRIITADYPSDQTEFYGMDVIVRGDLYLGFLRVLRDDLPADPDGEAAGIGWTELTYSRDGESWTRIREPFMDRNPEPGSWDHAMLWTPAPTYVGDEMRYYFGGYSSGHKIETRSIGLATAPRDRFAALASPEPKGEGQTEPAFVWTRPVSWRTGKLTVNADAARGSLSVAIMRLTGEPVPGYLFEDCTAIVTDRIDHAVEWNEKDCLPDSDRDGLVIAFRLQDARLFGFSIA